MGSGRQVDKSGGAGPVGSETEFGLTVNPIASCETFSQQVTVPFIHSLWFKAHSCGDDRWEGEWG